MKALIPFALAALVAAGCSLISPRVAPRVANAVDAYCNEPPQARALYRDTINAALAGEGHEVRVSCHGDPAP